MGKDRARASIGRALWLGLVLFAGCASVTGCAMPSGETIDDNHGYGLSFDESSADGLRVRYANSNPPRVFLVDATYRDVASCMGVQALPTGPLVIFQDGLIARYADPTLGKIGDGLTWLDTGTIVLDSTMTVIDWSGTAFIKWHPMRHEMVHFLLHETGFPGAPSR